VPNVLPDIDGTATVIEYLAQEVERVTVPPGVFTTAEGEPPLPKFCPNSSAILGVPVFAFAKNETVIVVPA